MTGAPTTGQGGPSPGGPGEPLVATTRGDANPSADPWRLALAPGTQLGQQRLAVPLLGRALAGGRHTALPVAAGALLLASALALRRRPLACACAAAGHTGRAPGTHRP